ncbi:hypothetical protein PIIN_04773 [Serendipita indica DSM 11827]|uniref:Transcription factor CBF/NF-Y/archaeal histone domain-containing protein n=1 Tax=Serendipita indica (strain DSM 11827) TaxID=1109443 RepID=G4THP5_SERID|nr:hypothetical protein PIIN_04773 [Serendipita indica DSM 11827]
MASVSAETGSKTRTRKAMQIDQHMPDAAAGPLPATGRAAAASDRQRKQPKGPKKTTATSQNARELSATTSIALSDEPASFRLSRVQKIVKMDNDSATISTEAVYLLALAAEEITRRITRATLDADQTSDPREITVPDIARSVAAAPSLSFLSDLIPPTVPLSRALEEREHKDTIRHQNPRQLSIQRIHEHFRQLHTAQPHKPLHTGSTTTNSAPRMLLPREGRSAPNAKKANGEPRPIAGGSAGPTAAVPKAFDYKNLPMPPPPGMFFQVPPGVDRNNLRWAPLPTTQDMKTKPLSTSANMSAPTVGPSIHSQPLTPATLPPPARAPLSAGQIGDDGSPETSTTSPIEKHDSPFDAGNLQGRTIYSASDGASGEISQEAKKLRRGRTRASGAGLNPDS